MISWLVTPWYDVENFALTPPPSFRTPHNIQVNVYSYSRLLSYLSTTNGHQLFYLHVRLGYESQEQYKTFSYHQWLRSSVIPACRRPSSRRFSKPGTEGQSIGVQILTFADVERGSRVVTERLVEVVGEILLERQAMALLSPSSADFLFTWLALMRLGHSVLLLAPQCQPSVIAHFCKTCNASFLFYSAMYADQASASKQAIEQENT